MLSTRKNTHHLSSGFSLVELLATIGIFLTLTGIIFFNFRTFSSRTVLDNLAHEIALTIRQAQVFGISVRSIGSGIETFPSYGAYFSVSENKTFLIFADIYPPGNPPGNGKYSASDTLIQQFAIQKGNFIDRICGYSFPSSSCTALDAVHITFTRPNPEGTIVGVAGTEEAEYSYTKIFVSSADRKAERAITAWSSGQISVQ